MSCDRAGTILHGYFDNELDAVGSASFERHLELCPDCANALEALESLRSSMNISQLYEEVPAELRKKILAGVSSSRRVTVFPALTVWQLLAIAAAILLVFYTGSRVTSVQRSSNYETVLAAEVVDAHLRSLQPGHLTDVVSSDQHTVKPWFDGKLEFSPPVRDFVDQGFPLQGGRLDVVRGHAIAALVYGRRKHLVSAFIWPTGEQNASPRAGSRQGYQWISWRKGGMEFWVVSDVAPSDLEQLQGLFTE